METHEFEMSNSKPISGKKSKSILGLEQSAQLSRQAALYTSAASIK